MLVGFVMEVPTTCPASDLTGQTSLHQIDLHMLNFLLRVPSFDNQSVDELYKAHSEPKQIPIHRVDGKPGQSHAPPHAIFPIESTLRANEVVDPEVIISDYGTSLIVSQTPSPELYTPALYAPPEHFFSEPITNPTAADI